VFCTALGGELLAGNVRRTFRRLTGKAGIGDDWTPRELRHSFVSLLSSSGVRIEDIADLCGHAGTRVTEACTATSSAPWSRAARKSWTGCSPARHARPETANHLRVSYSVGYSMPKGHDLRWGCHGL